MECDALNSSLREKHLIMLVSPALMQAVVCLNIWDLYASGFFLAEKPS